MAQDRRWCFIPPPVSLGLGGNHPTPWGALPKGPCSQPLPSHECLTKADRGAPRLSALQSSPRCLNAASHEFTSISPHLQPFCLREDKYYSPQLLRCFPSACTLTKIPALSLSGPIPPLPPTPGSSEGVSPQHPPRFCALLANFGSRPGGFCVKIIRVEVTTPLQ